MLRTWIKWRISLALDEGRSLSPLLSRWVRDDPECRRFYEMSRTLADRLEQDARRIEEGGTAQRVWEREPVAARVATPRFATLCPVERSPTPRQFWGTGVTALATALAIGFVLWWEPVARLPDDARKTVTQAEVIELTEILREVTAGVGRAAERRRPEWQKSMKLAGEALQKPLLREVRYLAADTQGLIEAVSLLLPLRHEGEIRQDQPTSTSSDL